MPSKSTPMSRRIADDLRRRRVQPCCICQQRIDYSLPADDEQAFTVEHKIPRSVRPDLADDPSNCGPAHAECNKRRGNREFQGLGQLSEEW